MVWNTDSAWFDTSGGRVRLAVCDRHRHRMGLPSSSPRFTEAAHRAATLRSGGRLNAPIVSWSVGQAG